MLLFYMVSLKTDDNGSAVQAYPTFTQRNPLMPPLLEEDFKQIREMFPNIEEDIVRAVYESNRGQKDHVINALLELGDVT